MTCIIYTVNGSVSGSMDTTYAICWVAYANEDLANIVRPVLTELVGEIKQLAPSGLVHRADL